MNRREYFNLLHPDPSGYIDLRAIRDGKVDAQIIRACDTEAIDAFIERHQPQRNICAGVADRKDASAGGTENLSFLHAIFADLDFKDFASSADAWKALEAFPLKPSMIVSSGNGIHPHWKLTSALDMQNGGAPKAKELLRRLALALGGDLQSAESARVLRVPETFNHKSNPPARVAVLTMNSAAVYSIDDIAAALDAMPAREVTPAHAPARPHGSGEPLAKAIPDGQRNSSLTSEAGRLRRLGWNRDEIYTALTALNQRCEPPLPLGALATIAASVDRYAPAEDTFPRTEQGDAEWFAHLNGGQAIYDHRQRAWFHFTAHHWHAERDGEINRLARDAMRGRQTAALKIEREEMRIAAVKWAIAGEQRKRLANMVALAQSLHPLTCDGEGWDANPKVLGVRNGVVDLVTGQLRDGTPDDRISNVSPLAYDPRADQGVWRQFVLDICDGDQVIADYLHTVIGYAITGLTSEQCFWLFHGTGANGKSTFAETITRHVIPAHAWSMTFPSQAWSASINEYQRAQLVGRRLVLSKETNPEERLNTEFMKSLTGDEEIQARHPYGRPFAFKPDAKFILLVNHKPVITDESHGMWRRVRLVPFNRTFPKDPSFAARLALEAPAALAWAIDGAVRYFAEGMKTPDAVLAATTEYQAESNPIVGFFDACCVFAPSASTRAQQVFEAYRDWCIANDVPELERLSQKAFGARVRTDGRVKVDVNRVGQTFYYGLGLLARESGM